jgi:hypothetical protein
MVWFAHPTLGFLMYFPIAAAVLLFAWSHMDYAAPKGRQLLPYHILGPALVNAALAAAATSVDAGIAMIFALWGGAGVAMALCMVQGVSSASLLAALTAAVLPIYTWCVRA